MRTSRTTPAHLFLSRPGRVIAPPINRKAGIEYVLLPFDTHSVRFSEGIKDSGIDNYLIQFADKNKLLPEDRFPKPHRQEHFMYRGALLCKNNSKGGVMVIVIEPTDRLSGGDITADYEPGIAIPIVLTTHPTCSAILGFINKDGRFKITPTENRPELRREQSILLTQLMRQVYFPSDDLDNLIAPNDHGRLMLPALRDALTSRQRHTA